MNKSTAAKKGLIRTIRRDMRLSGAEAVLVSGEKDVLYLTGFFVPGAKVLVTRDGGAFYFIDSMNESLARKMLGGLDLAGIISGQVLSGINGFIRGRKIKHIGMDEERLSVKEYSLLKKGLRGVTLTDTSSMLADKRERKKDHEISILRKASKKTVKMWGVLRKNIRTGMSEKEISAMADTLVRSEGYENSFPTIAAIGKNSAYPHAIPTNRRMKEGEHVLLDFGIRCDGYCSDLTRTYYKGRINRQIRKFREIVLKSRDFILKRLRPGVMIGSLVKDVNSIFIKDGVGDYVLHGLGHGVGLDIHEKPLIYEGSRERFKQGMVITVEPGLYKAGLGGFREEDMVLITPKGCEVLTK